jgi:methylase of polypeptide subunit release factors
MSGHTPLTASRGGLLDWVNDRPDVASRLRREPPDRVLVLACRSGAEALALATTFPNTTVYGIDSDPREVEAAQSAAQRSSARDRVLFMLGSPVDPPSSTPYDIVVATGLMTDPARHDRPGVNAAVWLVARLVDDAGLAFLDSPLPLEPSTVREAGFSTLDPLGTSEFDCPAYLLRR